MVKQYKKIIKEIMGPDLKERGFKPVKLESPGLSRTMLACYEKEYDKSIHQISIEISCFIYLELYAIEVRETRTFDNKDIESFRQVISEYAEIMREKGYRLIDEYAEKIANRPEYTAEEQLYLLYNYERLAEEFCRENQLDKDMPFMDKMCLLKDLVESSRELPFEEVKEKLMKIAAFYAMALLGCEKVNSYLVNSGGRYLTVSGALRGTIQPLRTLLFYWLNERDSSILKSDCKSVLQPEQYDSLEWKF